MESTVPAGCDDRADVSRLGTVSKRLYADTQDACRDPGWNEVVIEMHGMFCVYNDLSVMKTNACVLILLIFVKQWTGRSQSSTD